VDPADTVREIIVESQLEEKGYRKALISLGVFRLRLVAPILAFFAFGALAAGRSQQAIFLFATLIGMGVIVYLWALWHAHSPANRGVYAPVEYRFSSEHVLYESAGEIGEITWPTFRRWRYMADHYLLHVTSAKFVAIPTHCVAPDDIAPLERLFADKIRKGPRGPRR
jgi:hypothetical protein